MRIQKVNRLVITCYTVLSLCSLVGLYITDQYEWAKDNAHQRLEQATQLADQLLAGSKNLTTNVRAYAATGEALYEEEFNREVNVTRTRDTAVTELRQLKLKPEEITLIDQAKVHSDNLIALERQAFAARHAGAAQQAINLVYGQDYKNALTLIYGAINNFRQRLLERLEREIQQAHVQANWSRKLVQGSLILNMGTVLGILLFFYQRRVVQPLVDINNDLNNLQTQERSPISYLHEHSEIGDLARSLDAFQRIEQQMVLAQQRKQIVEQLSANLRNVNDHAALARAVMSLLSTALGVRYGLFYGVDEAQQKLKVIGGYGIDRATYQTEAPFSQGLAGECARHKQIITLEQLPADYFPIVTSSQEYAPLTLILYPLCLNQRVLGILELATQQRFGTQEQTLLAQLESVILMHLENIEHHLALQNEMQEQKLAETQLQAILRGISDGIFSCNSQGEVTFINPAALNMLGFNAEELVGASIHPLIHHHYPDGSDYPQDACPMQHTLHDGLSRAISDEVFWCKDGSPLAITYTCTPMLDAQQQIMGSIITFRPLV